MDVFYQNFLFFLNQGGSEVGKNKGWIQQTKCDELPCPETCTSGWQFSDGMVWRTDSSLKPTCGKYSFDITTKKYWYEKYY